MITKNILPLGTSTLGSLGPSIAVPSYERTALTAGVVHIGAGSFNRSHLAVYLDDLLQQPKTERWAECGVGLLPADESIHAALKTQGHLYSLLLRDADQQSLRVIGSLMEHLYAPAMPELVMERMSSPDCAIVSLTVTEGGYFIDHRTKNFLADHPDLQFDLAHASSPKTFLGFIAEAADRRRRRGLPPFTVLSCDNLQGNGTAARDALLGFAEMRDPELRQWIETNVAFPNSMVDRITPSTSAADKQFISENFHLSDKSPVVAEPFRQWVFEDEFSNERPRWEIVGAQVVSDVTPFERVKMRLLNGGHSTLAYVSALLGITFVSDALHDPLVRRLLMRFLDEVTPILPELAGMELAGYKESILQRFSNPTIRDQIARICSEGSAKIAKFIVPSIDELRSDGRPCEVIPLVIATWLYSMRGADRQNRTFAVVDASTHLFQAFAQSGYADAKQALSVSSVFGKLGEDMGFANRLQTHLTALQTMDTRDAVRLALQAIEKDSKS